MGKILIVILTIYMVMSCEKQSMVNDPDIPYFEYSDSPIDLKGIEADFVENISYGPYTENKFDVFLPKSSKPTPMVIYIHGGGFISGDKETPYTIMWNGNWDFPGEIRTLLDNKIAFASINYRLIDKERDEDGVLKSLEDSQRALQYIRSISKKLNIDKANILLAGSSAGGGTAEWLAFGDDRADPDNTDPVLRESTRVKGIAVKATQASYDLQRYETDVFKEYNFKWKEYLKLDPSMIPRFLSFYGMDSLQEFYSNNIKEYREKVDMLAMMTPDDPEIWVDNPQTPVVEPTKSNILNHHSFQARTLKLWADSIGIPNVVYYGYHEDPGGEDFVSFMIRKLR